MGRNKKNQFKLNPEWMFKKPLDFEYNKYTLLDYLQKCESTLNKMELYPDFIELSLHLANVQSIYKQKKLLTTKKKFESCDDEILVRDLTQTPFGDLTQEENIELEKTITYSGIKLFDTFNFAKSIWNLVYDNVDVFLRKNKDNLSQKRGFVFFVRKETGNLIVWQYVIKKQNRDFEKLVLHQIFEGSIIETGISQAIDSTTSFSNYNKLPIFEVKCSQYFPMEQTFLPMIKRKLQSYILQSFSFTHSDNFDI